MKIKVILYLLVTFGFFIVSCNPSKVFEQNERIVGAKWNKNSKILFNYQVLDTVSPCNLYINIRHIGLYQYSNLYLFVYTKAPNGKQMKDTVEVILADNKGKWKGKGIGDLSDIRVVYKKNICFGLSGKYQFEIQQAMRDETLESITDVGLRIEKAE
jgi:gliding motility-associated lipoprotein GldH